MFGLSQTTISVLPGTAVEYWGPDIVTAPSQRGDEWTQTRSLKPYPARGIGQPRESSALVPLPDLNACKPVTGVWICRGSRRWTCWMTPSLAPLHHERPTNRGERENCQPSPMILTRSLPALRRRRAVHEKQPAKPPRGILSRAPLLFRPRPRRMPRGRRIHSGEFSPRSSLWMTPMTTAQLGRAQTTSSRISPAWPPQGIVSRRQ